MTSTSLNRPAILGGTPLRPAGPPGWPLADDATEHVLREMIRSGGWGRYHGPHVPELCQKIASFHGTDHVHLCSSGTSAVELALRGVGVRDGDEVILAAYDFKANFQNVLHLGAIPVLVDVDPITFQFDPSQLVAACSPKTRAVLISHLHGGVVDLRGVRQVAESRGIAVIEDACQNPGANLFGKRAGTSGDVGVLSFGGSKLLTAGRGGAVLTSQPLIAERIKRYVLRGNDAYPLSEIQAALVVPQIEALDAMNEKRSRAVNRIWSALDGLPGLTPLQLPTDELQPVYYKLGFRITANEFGLSREHFAAALRAEGIAMDAGFRSNHLIHGSRRFRAIGELAQAKRADEQIVNLHHPVLLEDTASVDQVAEAIWRVHRHAKEISNITLPSCDE